MCGWRDILRESLTLRRNVCRERLSSRNSLRNQAYAMRTLLILAICLPLHGQDAFLWSQASFASASLFDTASSWHGPELNPILGRGQFGWKQAAIKEAATAGMLMAEMPLIRRIPKARKWFTVFNFAAAALTAGMAIRNEAIQ